MRVAYPILALGLGLFVCAPTVAQQDFPPDFPHLEFVQRLRDMNYTDQALEYLELLRSNKNLPKKIRASLPLELARIQLEQASQQQDGAIRNRLYNEAKKNLQAFLKVAGKSPDAAEANFELARIEVREADDELRAAKQLNDEKARKEALIRARKRLEQAGAQIKKAHDSIVQHLLFEESAKLSRAKLSSELEMALNLFRQMETYDAFDLTTVEKRTDLSERCLKQLQNLSIQDENNPICWVAKAWIIRVREARDEFNEGIEAYKKIRGLEGPAAEPGRRLANYFYLSLLNRKGANTPEERKEIIEVGETWRRRYSPFLNTPEGHGVLKILADTYRNLGTDLQKKNVVLGKQYLKQALDYYTLLSRTESDFSREARDWRIEILLKLNPGIAEANITSLDNFDDCYVRAQIVVRLLNKKVEKKAKPEEIKKDHEQIVKLLDRGLAFADSSVGTEDLVNARYMLMYSLMLLQRPLEAALHGEYLARNFPHSAFGGLAGAYALHAYGQVLDEQIRTYGANSAVVQIDMERMKELAHYLAEKFPNKVAGDTAHQQLGMLALQKQDFGTAANEFSRISPSYGNYNQVQMQLAYAAQQAAKNKVAPPKGKSWEDIASAALARIKAPDNPDNVDDLRYFIGAKVELLKVQYAKKQYDQMEALLKDLYARLDKVGKSPRAAELKAQLESQLNTFSFYAKYGKAFDLFNSNKPKRYQQVLQILDRPDPATKQPSVVQLIADNQRRNNELRKKREAPTQQIRTLTEQANREKEPLIQKLNAATDPNEKKAIEKRIQDITARYEKMMAPAREELAKLAAEEKKIMTLDPRLSHSILGMALSANLLTGNSKRATTILNILGSSGGFESTAAILTKLVADITRELDNMKESGDKAGYDAARKQIANFLAILAEQPFEKMSQTTIRFLALAYIGVEMYDEALALLDKVPEAAGKEQKFYHSVMVLKVRCHRLKKDFDKAEKLMKEIMATFGKSNLDALKEEIFLSMDQNLYGYSANKWKKLMEMVKAANRMDEYHACLYNYVYCVYKYASTSKSVKTEADKQNFIRRAANLIVAIEKNDKEMGGLRDKYMQLLEREPDLKKAYEELKKAEAAAK
ncbi:MAG: hypothetical protein KatS3mg105_3777 [Gemmatales bacterium]|nr:MAG: hypothetical protein KatS3mg105_3777 [Gemmatales bacterium]